MMMLSQALRLTCSFGSNSDPIAYTLFSILLAAVADGGGEAVDGGVRLRVTAAEMGARLGISSKRTRLSMSLLQDFGLLKFSDTRYRGIIYFEVVIPMIEETDTNVKDSEMGGDFCTHPCTDSCIDSCTQQRKKKETKEAVSPQTPFPLERKDKKKERASRSSFEKEKKKKKNKTDFSIFEKEKETDAQPASPQSADGARASLDDRRNAFWQQLQPYVPLYGEDSVKSFFNHWRRCNKNTGIMMFEDDEYFEIEVYLDEWHRTRKHKFSQRRGYRGGGSGETAAVSRGSVAEERAAEQARQRERIREQSAEQQAESELERLEKQLDYVPPEIISYLKGKGLQPSAMQPDEILTIIKPDELSWDQTRVLEQWQAQRRNVINTIARL